MRLSHISAVPEFVIRVDFSNSKSAASWPGKLRTAAVGLFTRWILNAACLHAELDTRISVGEFSRLLAIYVTPHVGRSVDRSVDRSVGRTCTRAAARICASERKLRLNANCIYAENRTVVT